MKIKDGKIYSTEIDKWVDIDEMLQYIVDVAADGLPHDLDLKFVSCCDANGDRYQYPTIKTFTYSKSEDVKSALEAIGIDARIDCYEDDDGDDGYGRPIILRRWSVEIPELKLSEYGFESRYSSHNWRWCNKKKEYIKNK